MADQRRSANAAAALPQDPPLPNLALNPAERHSNATPNNPTTAGAEQHPGPNREGAPAKRNRSAAISPFRQITQSIPPDDTIQDMPAAGAGIFCILFVAAWTKRMASWRDATRRF